MIHNRHLILGLVLKTRVPQSVGVLTHSAESQSLDKGSVARFLWNMIECCKSEDRRRLLEAITRYIDDLARLVQNRLGLDKRQLWFRNAWLEGVSRLVLT